MSYYCSRFLRALSWGFVFELRFLFFFFEGRRRRRFLIPFAPGFYDVRGSNWVSPLSLSILGFSIVFFKGTRSKKRARLNFPTWEGKPEDMRFSLMGNQGIRSFCIFLSGGWLRKGQKLQDSVVALFLPSPN